MVIFWPFLTVPVTDPVTRGARTARKAEAEGRGAAKPSTDDTGLTPVAGSPKKMEKYIVSPFVCWFLVFFLGPKVEQHRDEPRWIHMAIMVKLHGVPFWPIPVFEIRERFFVVMFL